MIGMVNLFFTLVRNSYKHAKDMHLTKQRIPLCAMNMQVGRGWKVKLEIYVNSFVKLGQSRTKVIAQFFFWRELRGFCGRGEDKE